MAKRFLSLLLLMCLLIPIEAQINRDIQKSNQRKEQERAEERARIERERQEEQARLEQERIRIERERAEERARIEREQRMLARIQESQITLFDQIYILQENSVDVANNVLSNKGWISEVANGKDQTYEMTLSWSFDKYDYTESAAWFYWLKHQNHYNRIEIKYNFESAIRYNLLLEDLKEQSFKQVSSSIVGDRVKTTYRNDRYEMTIYSPFEEGYVREYETRIYDYKREDDIIKQEAAVLKEKEALYSQLINDAKDYERAGNYRKAKELYENAKNIGLKGKSSLDNDIAKANIEILLHDADSLVNRQFYDQAKSLFLEAKSIRPNHRIDYINSQLAETEKMLQFLKERQTTVYDYRQKSPYWYNYYADSLLSELKSIIVNNTEDLPVTNFQISCRLNILGETTANGTMSRDITGLTIPFNGLVQNLYLKPCIYNEYSVMAKADFNWDIEYNHSIITLKKTSTGLESSNNNFMTYKPAIALKLGSNAPYAEYTFDATKMGVNGTSSIDTRMTDMKIIGGPACAWLSVLVPGLGDHKVTYGAKKGVGVALFTYAFVGTGAGLLLYDYFEGFTTDMPVYAGYSCLAVGGIIWLSDIIWVAARGAKNKKNAKEYKESHLNAFYDPTTKAKGLSYSLKF